MIYLILPLLFIVSEQDTTEVDSILTNTVICIQEDDLKWTPIPELLSQQIGIVWYHGQLHFRGGRAGEVVYLVDGVDVTDLVSGIPYITCNNEAISKMWVALDGFDIEYGNAMSGVVNIITKEGGDYYSGDLIYSNGIEYGEHRLNLNLGGPLRIIKNMNIFLSGSMYQTDDYSPSILAKSNNKLRDLNGMAKLVWNPNPFLKLTLKGDILSENYHIYDHSRSRAGWSEDFPLYKSRYSSILLSVSQNLSTNVSYILKAGILNSSLNASSQNGKHYNNWKAIGVRLPWVSLARDSGWY
ncbi:hypothetical protein KAX35_08745, partial [candidate division WOR-3 bacterium]|nr:hypothetical protein [candidate division WOR-3 bacterium]